MSYLTLEVEIDHGKVVAKEPSRLPDKGSGLLTILQSDDNGQPKLTAVQALDALQKHLNLDAQKAAEWMSAVREARRARPVAVGTADHRGDGFPTAETC
jgi:hypothetical protein